MLRKKVLTAVEIDGGELRMALLGHSRRGWEVLALHRYPGPGLQAWEEGDVEEVAAVLRAALKSLPRAGRRVITALGGPRVILRQLQLPPMPPKELEQAVVWEAERLLPFPSGELVVRPVVLGENRSGQQNVLLVAAPRELVYRYHHIFRRAGLQIVAIDLQHLALWRVFHGPFGHPAHNGGVRAVLNLGLSFSQFIILRGQELAYLRSLPVGLGEVRAFSYGGEDATVEIEREAAFTAEEAGGQNLLEALMREVRRSLDFYQLQEREYPVEELVVTGQLSGAEGLLDMLRAELGLPVEAGRPFISKAGGGNEGGPEDSSFAVALGLALREVLS
ncbi:type IV pilus biogenesis protein PilM [Desulfovirgula thermocuniculi]|uniref:type IV pilus biogenesis protein PilM n=1 Tax=Desulfovirgula thermocuniculi TaxID=348842 RepID=UPI0004034080|nr:pilus assembly protein PilM [Desulfovirgula thermocuniculi]